MAEAILTRKKVKEFPLIPLRASLALFDTELARLAKNLFVRNGPGDTGYRDCQDKQPDDLKAQVHRISAPRI
jgi:hypothetical protein